MKCNNINSLSYSWNSNIIWSSSWSNTFNRGNSLWYWGMYSFIWDCACWKTEIYQSGNKM